MATLVLGTPPPELEALLERRHQAGVDRLDEVARDGGLLLAMHEFNLGESERDFRVPDGGLHRPGAAGVWLATAAIVVEILSPGDESWLKLPFYAAHDVDEVLLVDPAERTVTWLALRDGAYVPVVRSALIELGPAELTECLDWPPAVSARARSRGPGR
jgi:Putative restriction endonuclease